MAFVRSPHAHARVHTKGPGAFIFTAKDLAGRVSPGQIVPPPGLDVSPIPHPLLADGEVRYVGQPVAAVVAESRALAEDLAEQVEVEYEPLPAVLDPRAGDPIVRWEQRAGDVAGAFARAAHVVRTERVIGRLTNSLLEGSGALAVPDGERLTVWTSSLSAHRPRAQLAQMLRRDEASLRVIVPDVGGGFGSKGTLPVETPVVAFAAAELGRPVRWTEDRREQSESSPQGRGIRGWVELALDADGRILALRGRILADLGAYLLPSTAIPAHTTAMLLTGAYDIPAVEVIVTGARTNRVPTAPYRGAGRPEATELIETAIDAAARQLQLDPVRAAPAQPGARVPAPDGARVDVRRGRLRALPGPRARTPGRGRHGTAHRRGRRARDRAVRRSRTSAPRSPATGSCAWARFPPGPGTRRCSRRSRPPSSGSTWTRSPSSPGTRTSWRTASAPSRAARRRWAAPPSPPRPTTCSPAGPVSRASPPTRDSRPLPMSRSSTSTRRRARSRCAGSSP